MLDMFIISAINALRSSDMLSAAASNRFLSGFFKFISLLDYTEFLKNGVSALKIVVIAVGGGLAVLGVVNLLEGYGNDNPGANAHVR